MAPEVAVGSAAGGWVACGAVVGVGAAQLANRKADTRAVFSQNCRFFIASISSTKVERDVAGI
jgi:hypothetical protein